MFRTSEPSLSRGCDEGSDIPLESLYRGSEVPFSEGSSPRRRPIESIFPSTQSTPRTTGWVSPSKSTASQTPVKGAAKPTKSSQITPKLVTKLHKGKPIVFDKSPTRIISYQSPINSIREQNQLRDITLTTLYENDDLEQVNGLLYFLRKLGQGKRRSDNKEGTKQVFNKKCETTKDVYVNYVYEYDIQNQVMNSSLRDPNSETIKRINTFFADAFAEECYKRNLVQYVIDDARLVRILDVSKLYKNEPTLRFYASINCSKNLIPLISRIFEVVFEKLQNDLLSKSNKKMSWGDMELIPIKK
ncbi:unnamed protein product [Didymodactylos carnosus]|uniref:Uncharacterized protein n=1 Tax=Didymodactylos carnosus TaxID=1234261 RepID=A0A8S2EHM2_9BILA|nr:unnamed protein product [Didymodactylos carnosus]CAF4017506.1 unnamed protein product [Didymodactylos carnosus]